MDFTERKVGLLEVFIRIKSTVLASIVPILEDML